MYQVEKFKIPRVKLKCKYYVLKSMQCNEDSSKRKDYNTKYIYKIFQRPQINTLKMYVKYLEKQNRQHWNMGIINQNQD